MASNFFDSDIPICTNMNDMASPVHSGPIHHFYEVENLYTIIKVRRQR